MHINFGIRLLTGKVVLCVKIYIDLQPRVRPKNIKDLKLGQFMDKAWRDASAVQYARRRNKD